MTKEIYFPKNKFRLRHKKTGKVYYIGKETEFIAWDEEEFDDDLKEEQYKLI